MTKYWCRICEKFVKVNTTYTISGAPEHYYCSECKSRLSSVVFRSREAPKATMNSLWIKEK